MKKSTRRANVQVYHDAENARPKMVKVEKEPVKRRPFAEISNRLQSNGTESKICQKKEKIQTLKTKPILKEPKKKKTTWDYDKDTYKYLIVSENNFLIKKDHLQGRKSFPRESRSILVDWMIEIHGLFDLASDSLHLAVYALDKYTEVEPKSVTHANAQLVAATCLFLASKFEEAQHIDQNELTKVCDPSITTADVYREEIKILKSLEFRLNLALPIEFVRRFSKHCGLTAKEYTLAKFFTDASLVSYELVGERPSILAAGCLFLALAASRGDTEPSLVWNQRFVSTTDYSFDHFSHVLRPITASVVQSFTTRLQSSRIKYSSRKYFSVSQMPSCQPTSDVITRFYSS